MLEAFGLDDDPVIRDEVARLYTEFQVAKWNNQRALDKIKAGGLPGPELSTAKLALTNNLKAFTELVARVLGPRIIADTGEWGTYAWSKMLLGVPGMRVAGGTDEIMRTSSRNGCWDSRRTPASTRRRRSRISKVGTVQDD